MSVIHKKYYQGAIVLQCIGTPNSVKQYQKLIWTKQLL